MRNGQVISLGRDEKRTLGAKEIDSAPASQTASAESGAIRHKKNWQRRGRILHRESVRIENRVSAGRTHADGDLRGRYRDGSNRPRRDGNLEHAGGIIDLDDHIRRVERVRNGDRTTRCGGAGRCADHRGRRSGWPLRSGRSGRSSRSIGSGRPLRPRRSLYPCGSSRARCSCWPYRPSRSRGAGSPRWSRWTRGARRAGGSRWPRWAGGSGCAHRSDRPSRTNRSNWSRWSRRIGRNRGMVPDQAIEERRLR